MKFFGKLNCLILMLILASVSVVTGAETADSLAQTVLSHATEHHGLPESAQKIGSFITNSMIVT
jgi:hypothetical protein